MTDLTVINSDKIVRPKNSEGRNASRRLPVRLRAYEPEICDLVHAVDLVLLAYDADQDGELLDRPGRRKTERLHIGRHGRPPSNLALDLADATCQSSRPHGVPTQPA